MLNVTDFTPKKITKIILKKNLLLNEAQYNGQHIIGRHADSEKNK